jgi:hypothetical protein
MLELQQFHEICKVPLHFGVVKLLGDIRHLPLFFLDQFHEKAPWVLDLGLRTFGGCRSLDLSPSNGPLVVFGLLPNALLHGNFHCLFLILSNDARLLHVLGRPWNGGWLCLCWFDLALVLFLHLQLRQKQGLLELDVVETPQKGVVLVAHQRFFVVMLPYVA